MKRRKPKRRKLPADEAAYQQIKMPFVRVCMASVVSEWVRDDEPVRVPEVRKFAGGTNK